MGQNYILQFGATLEPPYVQTDAAYAADSSRIGGWPAPEVVPQDFLNKLHLQSLVTASGLSQFIADNQVDDVVDTLTPAQYAALLTSAIRAMSFTTQPKFDQTTKAATTQFVQNALGNFSSTQSYSVDTVLNGLDIGRLLNAGANNITLTLPLLADSPTGSKITIRGNGYTGIKVARQSADVIVSGTSAVSYVNIGQFDIIELTNNGVSGWYVTGGNEQLNTCSQFMHTTASNGYISLPGGLIFQRGIASVSFGPSTSQTSIDLPTPWSVGLLNATWNFYGTAPPSVNNNGSIYFDNSNPLTKLKFYGYSGTSLSEGIYWTAIGI